MRTKAVLVLATVLALASLAGCKKTEKGQSEAWQRSLQAVSELSTNYPGFKAALEEARSTASEAMEVAKKVGDKEKRIEAMAAANRLLSGGFVDKLKSADDRIKQLRKQLVDLAGDVTTDDEKRVLSEAKRQVEKSLRSVESILKAGAADAAAAAAVLAKATKELDFAKDTLKQVSDRVSKRKRADKKAAGDEVKAKAAADDAEKAKTAPWTCEYCDHSNPHDATKCSNCGAERGGPAPK